MDDSERLEKLKRLAELRAMAGASDIDPAQDMPWYQQAAAGAGKAVSDVGRGIGQIIGVTPQSDIDEAKLRDAPLMRTGAGMAGNIAGNVGMFVPTAAIPGANTFTGAALLGAGMGALQPTATGESRGMNTALGGAAGFAGQGAGKLLGRALRPVASELNPERAALARAAANEGIPLTAGQATGSRPIQIAESVMENLPLTSAPQLAGREGQQRAFTAAALRRAGIASDTAAPDVLATQKGALGGKLESIAKGNELDFNQGLVNDLSQIAGEAGKRGKTASEPVTSLIDNILAEVNQAGKMSGENYQAWRQMLRPLGKGPDGHYYDQIRKALDSAFNSQMAATGSEAWKGANRQYANLKTIMQAAGGPGEAAAINQIAPSQLSAALRAAMQKEGVALGRGDLNELSRVGQVFVRDQVPNSGTAQRQLIQNLLTGQLAGAGVGGGLGYIEGGGEGAMLGAALGAGGSLVLPRAVQAAMNSPAGQAYLTKGIASLSHSQRAALSNSLRLLSVGAVPALEGQR